MVQNAKTRAYARPAIARALMGTHFVTGTATGGSTSTMVDSKLANGIYADDVFNNREINVQDSWATGVTDWVKSTGTATFATQASTASLKVYEIYPRGAWTSTHINDALDRAIEEAAHRDALTDATDESLAYQCYRCQYPLPAWSYISRIALDCKYSYIGRNATSNFDTLLGIKSTSGQQKVAQQFTVGSVVGKVIFQDAYLLLAKVGSPTGTITLTLEGNSSDAPDGSALATMTFAVSSTTLLPTYQRFLATVVPLLAANTAYWLVATADYSASAANHVAWVLDSNSSYNGLCKVYDGATWTLTTGNLIFSVRRPYKHLLDLEYRKHWILSRQSTRQFELTEAGQRLVRTEDGGVFYLEGQSRPSLVTLDSTSIDVPFDYLHYTALVDLASANPDWYQRLSPNNQQVPFWREKSLALAEKLRTPLHANAVQIEAM